MKKTGIMNRDISDVVASLGHGDMLVISDAGLSIPEDIRRIDLALKPGVPGLMETAEVVFSEMKVDRVIVPEMMSQACPEVLTALEKMFAGISIDKLPTDVVKQNAWNARAIIRTGECTPYATIILVAGVTF